LASIATPIGLLATVYQLHQTRRALRDSFERSFVDRYQRVVSQIDLNVMLGRAHAELADPKVRRAFFDYFELCEEELYYRAFGKVSAGTWRDWWYGMTIHFRSPSFEAAFAELVVAERPPVENSVPDRFSLLRVAFEHRNDRRTYEPTRPRGGLRNTWHDNLEQAAR
jgi:hypothetical protein